MGFDYLFLSLITTFGTSLLIYWHMPRCWWSDWLPTKWECVTNDYGSLNDNMLKLLKYVCCFNHPMTHITYIAQRTGRPLITRDSSSSFPLDHFGAKRERRRVATCYEYPTELISTQGKRRSMIAREFHVHVISFIYKSVENSLGYEHWYRHFGLCRGHCY